METRDEEEERELLPGDLVLFRNYVLRYVGLVLAADRPGGWANMPVEHVDLLVTHSDKNGHAFVMKNVGVWKLHRIDGEAKT